MQQTNPVIDEFGDRKWYQNKQLHRVDGPSCECADGSQFWYRDGQLNRTGGPAVTCANRNGKIWYIRGAWNSPGSAIDLDFGEQRWYQRGLLHRLDGPAIATGDVKYWYQKGKLHRVSGPAIEYAVGVKFWYINGVKYTAEQFQLLTFINSRMTV
jgi:hypothetical protein